ncbi:MAG TPA: AraC family transcriptional regulator, partial [Clostridia bacterium]|nr:AraC family transcriptional regulator [Clostridia bacterium]
MDNKVGYIQQVRCGGLALIRRTMSAKEYKEPKKSIAGVASLPNWEQVAIEADFQPAKMATLCAISERHLQRIFKKHLQCTPSQWLRELQCRRAKNLISQGYSSKAAAAELKFATDSHFCREFKKVFGAPPQSF